MRKLLKYSFILIVLGIIGSCKKFDKLLDNPNSPRPEQADVDLYLNQVQLSFQSFFHQAQDFGSQLTRMTVYYGPTYQNGYSPQSFDDMWSTAYTGVLKNVNAMIPLAKQQAKYYHAGIGEILKAYTLFTMVDLFGDVPYTEANLGNDNLNPKVESGKNIYAAAITLLDSAIADLGKTSASNPTNILFANQSKGSWIKVANTLKLRAYVQTRLVDNTAGAKIQALANSGSLITSDADEFAFRYGNQQSTPNSRHPRFNEGYKASGGASNYIGTQFMYSLRFEKPMNDPRTRYYFYRQTVSTPGTQQQQPCAYTAVPTHYPAGMPYCVLNFGFWGRDHGDNSGIPPDGNLRTVWGVYPAGGKYDCSDGVQAGLNDGGKGAGIAPIWMSFFTDFALAEAALTTSGYAGDARSLLQSAVTKSIKRVQAFPAEVNVTPCAQATPSAAAVNNYINYVMSLYDAATSTDEKLDVVLKEFYIAQWGNGLEAYNMYRRSSRPRNLQLTVQPNPGPFIRSFLYPSVHVNLNSNAHQKPNFAVKVFWDTNSDVLQ